MVMVINEQEVGKLWFLHSCFDISFDELLAHKFFHSFHENEREHSRLIVPRDSMGAPNRKILCLERNEQIFAIGECLEKAERFSPHYPIILFEKPYIINVSKTNADIRQHIGSCSLQELKILLHEQHNILYEYNQNHLVVEEELILYVGEQDKKAYSVVSQETSYDSKVSYYFKALKKN